MAARTSRLTAFCPKVQFGGVSFPVAAYGIVDNFISETKAVLNAVVGMTALN